MRVTTNRGAALAVAFLAGSVGCSASTNSQPGGPGAGATSDAADTGGIPDGGEGSACTLPGSPVTVSSRAADGTLSGTFSYPNLGTDVTFTVQATGDTSAIATYSLASMTFRVELIDRSHATVSSDGYGTVTGDGAFPSDAMSQALLSMLGGFRDMFRGIPLELGCG